ncbi:ABC transporter permease [Devosia sp.]|jgi:simple sugar transport system permease protein|uniref:ABC transporter permease n=1 Tax=Devosia sp. TaxID=1871048 RepID=UPI0037BF4608
MSEAAPAPRRNPFAGFFKIEGTAIALVLALLILLFMITAPRAFMGFRVYMSFMATVPPPMIIALGLTLVVVAGEMDLSFPSVVAMASYVFCIIYQEYDQTWLALIAALATGTVMGWVNGLVITRLGIPSLIATLAMLFLWGGLVTVVSNGASLAIPDIEDELIHMVFAGRLGVFPVQFVWAIVVAVMIWMILNRHRFGESLLFIGDSMRVAKVVGISTDREKIKLFTLMGTLSALAGVFLTLETTTYFSNAGMGYLLIVVAAVFIGGTSIFGGSGKVAGTVFGSLIVAIIEAGLVASGVQGFWTRFFIGLVFIVSVTMNAVLEDPDKVPLLKDLRSRARKQ